MPIASVIVPAFNVARTIAETLDALTAQTFTDLEIIIVDDGSTDDTLDVVRPYLSDDRVRVVSQPNRGLAGARNSGIAASTGQFVGFCDADDVWEPNKLDAHVDHLQRNAAVGVSYSGSALFDDDGNPLRTEQRPRLTQVDTAHILKRNPIGNGSAPVIRRAVLDQIAYRPAHETERDWYFDETFRQSEDLECWLRISLTTDWQFEGVEGLLTRYRISSGALSSNTERQFETWERVIRKLSHIDPQLFDRHAPAARAYQYRYLSRRAIRDLDAKRARVLLSQSFSSSLRPLVEEPTKTIVTLIACGVMSMGGALALSVLFAAKDRPNA